jgi:hypothetical protein
MGRNLEPFDPRQLQLAVHTTALPHPTPSSTTDRLHCPRHIHIRPPPPGNSVPEKGITPPPPKQPISSPEVGFLTHGKGLLSCDGGAAGLPHLQLLLGFPHSRGTGVTMISRSTIRGGPSRRNTFPPARAAAPPPPPPIDRRSAQERLRSSSFRFHLWRSGVLDRRRVYQ